MYNLFLDDYRDPEDCFEYTHQPSYLTEDWSVVRNYDDFVRIIKAKGLPIMISFDHDLADIHYKDQKDIKYDEYTEKTGFHCAKWMIDHCLDTKQSLPKYILVHSMNPVGTQNIVSLFNTYYKVYGK
jgi:hypothetical protein